MKNSNKLSQEARNEHEKAQEIVRYRTLVESTDDFIWSVDPINFGLTTFNSAIANYFLTQRGIVLENGMTPEMLVPESFQKTWHDLYQQTLEKGSLRTEYQTVSGTKILLLSLFPMVVENVITGISVFGQDITRLKAVESDLLGEKERYITLIESTDDMIRAVEPVEYGLTAFNSAFVSFYKKVWNIDIKPGMTPKELVPKERVKNWHDFYDRAIRDGKFIYDYQTIDGMSMNLRFSTHFKDSKIAGISVFAEDTTLLNKQKATIELNSKKLSSMLDQSIKAISRIGEIRDVYTAGHQRRVQELACAIAREMGLDEETVKNISFGALIHDIGKIYIPGEILNKPGKLTDLEYQILKTHALYSYEVVKEIDFAWQVSTMVRQHHERIDGSGYPDGLKGDEILLDSRILAVADVVEAISSHRPYRPALGIDAALNEISEFSGIKYDPLVSATCIDLFRRFNKPFSFKV